MVSVMGVFANLLCYTSIIKLQTDQIVWNNVAKGNCILCCPIDDKRDIYYILYTRKYPDGIKLPYDNPGGFALENSARNDTRTIVFVHGFSELAPGSSGKAIKDAYLETSDVNVILVDWRKLSAMPWYTEAVSNTRIVGKHLSKFLLKLDKGGIPIKNVHVIGFSLGAVAAGLAGKSMPENKRIPRITGLDPALPLYLLALPSDRLSTGDAEFVDVIHTDAGVFGHPVPMGDADFYPNGGLPLQPGCRADQILKLDGYKPAKYVTCSHQRAWLYYVESIRNPHGFPATQCFRWSGLLQTKPCRFTLDNYMGIKAEAGKKGRFYLETNPEPPFAKGLED